MKIFFMKITIISILMLTIGLSTNAQQRSLTATPQWTSVTSDSPEPFQIQLISSTENSIKVNVQVPGFYMNKVTTPKGDAFIISAPRSVSKAHAGEPNMPMTCIPVMIGDQAHMSARIIDARYRDIENVEVAPSKGIVPHNIAPTTVPYTYGDCYSQDAFFPADNLHLDAPYCIRDLRGQNVAVYPFAYNPVTKTLRVYYDMTVEMYDMDDNGKNIIQVRKCNAVKTETDPDFKNVYQRHFINYAPSTNQYTPLDEEGDLLIICYDDFISSMADFVNWKKTRGVNTTIVGTSTAGSTYADIKAYIRDQYNANNNLTHVLLVGDVDQIPGFPYPGGGNYYSGLGDNAYGQIVGNDFYNDVFIGRFSANTAERVTTQCNRVITYERDLTPADTWCQNGLGVSAYSNPPSEHNNERDYEHIENIRTKLLEFGYSTVYQDYYDLDGYPNSSISTISDHINNGVGIINNCNHGIETCWESHTPPYTTSEVNASTNDNKLPFIFAVSCLVGKYDYENGDCFAEAWMNATNGDNPTGAIGAMMSYIEQPRDIPLWAQEEFVDILVDSDNNNIKHTWGGAAVNSLFAIFDHYGIPDQAAVGTYQAWILFGDPSLMLRTKTPQPMTVSHNGTITQCHSPYTVNVSNGDGAVATITDADHNILGKAIVSGGTANISITGNTMPNTKLTLCVFGYNKVTYLGTINVVAGTQYYITCNSVEHGSINVPEHACVHSIVTLTAMPETGYCLSGWDVRDASNHSISVTNNQFTMPESNVTVAATFEQGMLVTLASVIDGSISVDADYALEGTIVNLTATPATGYVLDHWEVYKTGDENTTVTVNHNSFIMPDFDVTVAGFFTTYQIDDITIGNGSGISKYIPAYPRYYYSLSQQIYTPAETGEAGTIIVVAFKVANEESSARNMDIYLSHTSTDSFADKSDWIAQGTSYRVFSGIVDFAASGWTTITLDTPFEYDGTSNLLLTVDDNSGIDSTPSSPTFYVYSAGSNTVLYQYEDTDFDAASMSTPGKCSNKKNQMMFTKVLKGKTTPSETVDIIDIKDGEQSGISNFLQRGIYTLDGRKQNEMPTKKGLYIVNGKIVEIK